MCSAKNQQVTANRNIKKKKAKVLNVWSILAERIPAKHATKITCPSVIPPLIIKITLENIRV